MKCPIPLFLLLALLSATCTSNVEDEAPPEYHPFVLTPYETITTEGVVVDTEVTSFQFALNKEYKTAKRPVVKQLPTNYVVAGKPKVVPVKGKLIRLDSSKITYFKTEGKKVLPHWPKNQPTLPIYHPPSEYPFSYLDLGLSAIRVTLEDRFGRIWFGTYYDGLTVWDGTNTIQFDKSNGLLSGFVDCLLEDSKGNIWIGTSEGLSVWDGHHFTHFTEKIGLGNKQVFSLWEDCEGNIWIGNSGSVQIWDGSGITQIELEGRFWSIIGDDNGNIYLGNGYGFYIWDGSGFTLYSIDSYTRKLTEDAQGNILIGTWEDGFYSWARDSLYHYTTASGLMRGGIWDFELDRQGNIWMVSGQGLSVFDGKGFYHYQGGKEIPRGFYRCVDQVENGDIWIGGDGLGEALIWNENGLRQRAYGERFISDNIFSGTEDRKSGQWLGTNNGAILKVRDTLWRYTQEQGLLQNEVRWCATDNKGNIWMWVNNGVSVFDGRGFTNYTLETPERSRSRLDFTDARDGTIQLIVRDSLFHLWNEGQFQSIPLGDKNWAHYGYRDSRGNIWIGTPKGLFKWDGREVRQFSTGQGLPDNIISQIVEDGAGNIWVVSGRLEKQLSIYDGRQFLNFGGEHQFEDLVPGDQREIWCTSYKGLNRLTFDGEKIAVEQFSSLDGYKGSTLQHIFVGRNDRISIISSSGLGLSRIQADTLQPKVLIQQIDLFFDFVDWRQGKDTIARGEIPVLGSDSIPLAKVNYDSVFRFTNLPAHARFPHNINELTLHWAATRTAPHKLQYSYLLEGKDRDWSPLVQENKVTYTNLAAGDYNFKVRAVNGSGVWSEVAGYAFTILPPWWKTWWAWTLWMLLFFSLMAGIYQVQLSHQLAKSEASRLKELNIVKTNLYTNITHEFRTPLTIILGMADKVAASPGQYLSQGISMIKRNGLHLLRLVNQMLDLSKVEAGKLQLNMIQSDGIAYLKYVLESFDSFATAKNVKVHFQTKADRLMMDYDPEKIRHIMTNLLSNAIKFTPEGGNVYVNVDEASPTPSANGEARDNNRESFFYSSLFIHVKDTGIGIPADKLPHIFDRFYQADTSATRQGEGTGIGLTLTKELIQLLGGSIEVKSQVGVGTEFLVRLPVTREAPVMSILEETQDKEQLSLSTYPLPNDPGPIEVKPAGDAELPTLLIVEDNRDVLEYLVTCLEGNYQLEIAHDGQEGIDKALELVPDIIISDVMMPKKDGFELCYTLKNDMRTSHIPIVLLTAKADVHSRVAGLRRGADAYLTKPFNEQELQVRMQQLLTLRQTLRRKYEAIASGSSPDPNPETSNTPLEDEFLLKIHQVVEAHLDDCDFDVSRLCREVGLSRTPVHNKLKALTGKSTTEFIRQIRLAKARELLLSTDLHISEIAYETGFRNPHYFTKMFRKVFGSSPMEYREEESSNQ